MSAVARAALTAFRASQAEGRHVLRGLLLLLIGALMVHSPTTRGATISSLADAYLQVTAFVAGTLALVAFAESRLGGKFGEFVDARPAWQVPAAALLGAFPGCGGAIVVITNYAQGHLSFGAVVAVLTATMGDAAFVLISREPLTGGAIVALGAGVGLASGWIVDAVHGRDFLRPDQAARQRMLEEAQAIDPTKIGDDRMGPLAWLWTVLVIPGAVLGVLAAAQVDVNRLFGPLAPYEPATVLGVVGALLALTMWVMQPRGRMGERGEGGHSAARAPGLIRDTNYVTAWVVMSFLAFEVTSAVTAFDLASLFLTIAPVVPLVAIFVGFMPGCGPQIVVTTLYVSGIIPLSAQIGNAISNDGDALFPAIAAMPRAALVATLYSAAPALVLAYGYYLFFER